MDTGRVQPDDDLMLMPAPQLEPAGWPGPMLMDNPVQPYDWGSRTVLPRLQGRDPAGRPEAELWMGAHPLAPSRLLTADGGSICLQDAIDADPLTALGADCVARFGVRLPYLLKVLAIDRALSLQVHPDAAQAAAGHAREVAAGTAGPDRRFVDPHPKPELLVAVSHVQALAGWRDAERSAALLALLTGPRTQRLRQEVTDQGPVAGLALLAGWPATDRPALVTEVATAVRVALAGSTVERDPDALTALMWVHRLLDQHPGDPCVLAPLLLQVLAMRPGDGLFVPAGVPHAYLTGVGVEVMCASDNVVRAGLTSKPVDVPLLLELLDPAAAVTLTRAEPVGPHEALWAPPAREFRLGRIAVRPGSPVRPVPVPGADGGPQVLLCLGGEVVVGPVGGGPNRRVRVEAGRSVFVPAGCGPVELSGAGDVYRAVPG